MDTNERLSVSTPGRICLFGEHQDYLGLPVIAAAISLRIQITARHIDAPTAVLHLPDVGQDEEFPLTLDRNYGRSRDYLRSAANVMLDEGFTFGRGIEAEVHGTIPINSGTSSSSALVAAWVHVLAFMSDQKGELTDAQRAAFAHRAEVLEFSEPGGMMDHVATAYGGVLHFDPGAAPAVTPLPARLGPFVLADSGEPKDTTNILGRVKTGVLSVAARLHELDHSFSLRTVTAADMEAFEYSLTEDERLLLEATIENREITRRALEIFHGEPFDHSALGRLLQQHQTYLREPLRISTRKIDSMIEAAYDAGALGAKINGSGGGGCMFAYAPQEPEKVLQTLKKFGRAWIVQVDAGTKVDPPRDKHT